MHVSSALAALLCGSIALGVASANFEDDSGDDQISARDAFWSAKDLVAVPAPAPLPKRSVKLQKKVSLGLRYSILKLDPENENFKEVSPKDEFYLGDHIRFNVSADREGYLYVIEQGSSGTWKPLYPRPGSPGANKLLPGKSSLVPSATGVWTVKGDPGDEKLFFLLTLSPERNLDQIIASLKAETNKPSDIISSQVIARIEETQTRDLEYEDAFGKNPASWKDPATYVVAQASNPHVFINVTLKHR